MIFLENKLKIISNKDFDSDFNEIGLDKKILKSLLKSAVLEIYSVKKKYNKDKSGLYLEFPDKKMGISAISESLAIACFGISYYDPITQYLETGIRFCLFQKLKKDGWKLQDYFEIPLAETDNISLLCSKVRTALKRNAMKIDLDKLGGQLMFRSLGFKRLDFLQ